MGVIRPVSCRFGRPGGVRGVARPVVLFTLALSIRATTFGPAPAFSLSYPLSQPVSENPVNITPHVLDGTVYAIAEIGNRVVVAGSFTKVRRAGSTITRNVTNIFAYNPNDGRLDLSFRPNSTATSTPSSRHPVAMQ